MSLFFEKNALPLPSVKNSFNSGLPQNIQWVLRNERFKHPCEERKVNEKLTILISTLVCFVVKKGLTLF